MVSELLAGAGEHVEAVGMQGSEHVDNPVLTMPRAVAADDGDLADERVECRQLVG